MPASLRRADFLAMSLRVAGVAFSRRRLVIFRRYVIVFTPRRASMRYGAPMFTLYAAFFYAALLRCLRR